MSFQRNLILDWLRGLSSLAVFLGHLRNAFFVDYSLLQNPVLVQRFFYFVTGLAHQAVIVFFVLSGFLVGGSVLRSLKYKGTFSLGDYFVNRITRLWAVLVPALFYTAAIDYVLHQLYPLSILGEYRNIWNSGPEPLMYSSSLMTFICNSFFLQTVVCPVYGTNGALWSLSNEFWYYVLFPCLSLFFLSNSSLPAKLIYLAFFALVCCVLPSTLVLYFSIWLVGALVAFVLLYCPFRPTLPSRNSYLFLSLLLFLLSLVCSKSHAFMTIPFVSDFFVGLCSAVLIYFSVIYSPPIANPSANLYRIGLISSDTSYTLYLFHFPAVLLSACLFGNPQLLPGPSEFLFFLLLAISIWLLCFIFWFLFERNTSRLRSFFVRV
jgi:peptidoglycan/LPS O-acetylase OafA/YrhL